MENIIESKEHGEIIRRAVEKYGIEAQTTMLFEEMAELQNAICKTKRNRATADDVCTEIADVIIMCEQMAQIYGPEKVMQQMNYKLNRLKVRLSLRKQPSESSCSFL